MGSRLQAAAQGAQTHQGDPRGAGHRVWLHAAHPARQGLEDYLRDEAPALLR